MFLCANEFVLTSANLFDIGQYFCVASDCRYFGSPPAWSGNVFEETVTGQGRHIASTSWSCAHSSQCSQGLWILHFSTQVRKIYCNCGSDPRCPGLWNIRTSWPQWVSRFETWPFSISNIFFTLVGLGSLPLCLLSQA